MNDCVLDAMECSDYRGVDTGCLAMPIGDPLRVVKDRHGRDTPIVGDLNEDFMGRCDDREICNGLTGVSYVRCKTWAEALPMALAWVALIELLVAITGRVPRSGACRM